MKELNSQLRQCIVEDFADRVSFKFKPDTNDVLFDILSELWIIWHGKNPPEDFDEHSQFCEDINRCCSILTKGVKHDQ